MQAPNLRKSDDSSILSRSITPAEALFTLRDRGMFIKVGVSLESLQGVVTKYP